jgi:DNA replication protein DnaC
MRGLGEALGRERRAAAAPPPPPPRRILVRVCATQPAPVRCPAGCELSYQLAGPFWLRDTCEHLRRADGLNAAALESLERRRREWLAAELAEASGLAELLRGEAELDRSTPARAALLAAAQRVVERHRAGEPASTVLAGPGGVGKTAAAAWAARRLLAELVPVYATTSSELIDALVDDRQRADAESHVRRARALLLDDLGQEGAGYRGLTHAQGARLAWLLDHVDRERKTLVVTTNLTQAELQAHLARASRAHGEACMARLYRLTGGGERWVEVAP